MPGTVVKDESSGAQHSELAGFAGREKEHLQGQVGPLSYLRSRNALKIILDLDGGFGLGGENKLGREGWKNLPRIVGGGGGQ